MVIILVTGDIMVTVIIMVMGDIMVTVISWSWS